MCLQPFSCLTNMSNFQYSQFTGHYDVSDIQNLRLRLVDFVIYCGIKIIPIDISHNCWFNPVMEIGTCQWKIYLAFNTHEGRWQWPPWYLLVTECVRQMQGWDFRYNAVNYFMDDTLILIRLGILLTLFVLWNDIQGLPYSSLVGLFSTSIQIILWYSFQGLKCIIVTHIFSLLWK